MIKKTLILALAVTSTLVGLYPLIYLFIDQKFGLLETKSEALLASAVWDTAFTLHITLGGVALLVGWTQFISAWRKRSPNLHRQTGKLYVVSVLVSAVAGLYLALHATGGWVPAAGFVGMDLVWSWTTLHAFLLIRKKRVAAHRNMMIYSYATCFAAVTLRIYLPLFTYLFQDFITAYAVVAWLSWVSNLAVANIIIRNRQQKRKTAAAINVSAAGAAL